MTVLIHHDDLDVAAGVLLALNEHVNAVSDMSDPTVTLIVHCHSEAQYRAILARSRVQDFPVHEQDIEQTVGMYNGVPLVTKTRRAAIGAVDDVDCGVLVYAPTVTL